MMVRKCDKCKKTITENYRGFTIGRNYAGYMELCKKCADPIIQILLKADLIPESFVETWKEAIL
jgi:hypothetical protein